MKFLKADYAAIEKRIKPYLKTKYSRDLIELRTLTQGRFRYPVDKWRTQETVLAMRTAEAHLDDFWNTMNCPKISHKFSMEKKKKKTDPQLKSHTIIEYDLYS